MDSTAYRHIVVAINGSRESQAAVEHAAELARVSNASLDLLAVTSVPSTMYWGGATQRWSWSSKLRRRRPTRGGLDCPISP